MVRDLAVNCISQNPGAVNLFVSQHFPDRGPWLGPLRRPWPLVLRDGEKSWVTIKHEVKLIIKVVL